MSKYAPLGAYLRSSGAREMSMTFAEIERVIGMRLPAKAQKQRAWWSNNPSNNVMTKVWLDAGYRSERVDVDGRKLVFRRAKAGGANKEHGFAERSHAFGVAPADERSAPPHRRHPLLGALKGLIHIDPGTDLTAPADPEWADLAWGKEK